MNGLDVTGGDLTVGGTSFTVDATTGNTGITGTLAVSGNVDAMNGLDVTGGDLTVGGTNFTVDDATGNTDIDGTLTVDGATTLGSGDATDEVTVNTGTAGTDLVISEGGVDRSSSAVQTFAIDNSGTGHVNVLINGATSTTNSRLTVDDGHWTSQQTDEPTIAGLSGTTSARSITTNSTDVAGMISFTSTSTPGSAGQVTVTFNSPYSTPPIVVLTAANRNAGGRVVYATSTTDDFTVGMDTAPAASTVYEYYYHVIEAE